VVKQYPDTILVEWNSDSTRNDNGNPVKGSEQSFSGKCRSEMNGAGRAIPSPDGALVVYSYSVYMPKLSGVLIPFGAKVTVTVWDGSTRKGTVMGFKAGQLNSVLWL